MPTQLIEDVRDAGYAVVDLPDPDAVRDARDYLVRTLRGVTGVDDIELETYHRFIATDDAHVNVHLKMAAAVRERKLSRQLLLAQVGYFQPIFGPDIAMTCRDNLRMVRPQKEIDNLGYHRDWDYGNTAYELNVFIPFVDLDSKTALSVVPRSHRMGPDEILLKKTKNPHVEPNSARHSLGFMHSPIEIENIDQFEVVAPDVRVGQALVFVPHCIHGQIVNAGEITRWSVDFEICNALAPINWRTTSGEARFEVVTTSFFVEEGRRLHGDPR